MRDCEICGSNEKVLLHKQNFMFTSEAALFSYEVVSCSNCGFCYADKISNRELLHQFYQSSSHHIHSVGVPAGLADLHSIFFKFIMDNVPDITQISVLDIGSSMGHFLNVFKKAGAVNLLGLEPSVTAKEMAKKKYDIDVFSSSLENFESDQKFNLIILSGVLEHIDNINISIENICRLLQRHGYVFVAVPDAQKFYTYHSAEPFFEFAFEHINFFTLNTLENIFGKYGFELVEGTSEYNDFYKNNSLLALFKRSGSFSKQIQFDAQGPLSLKKYIDISDQLMLDLHKIVDDLIISKKSIIIWGAGAFSTRLCVTTRLDDTNLLGFVDRNTQLQGKTLLGRTIFPPSWFEQNKADVVLIASSVYAADIETELLVKYHWSGKIIRL